MIYDKPQTKEEVDRFIESYIADAKENGLGDFEPEDFAWLYSTVESEKTKALDDLDLTPTESMANAAERGLRLREEHGRGGTEVGVARARDLKNRKRMSPETVKRMHSFFSRHAVDLEAPAAKEGHEDYPSAGLIAWLLWGGDPGQKWAERKAEQIDNEKEKTVTKAKGDKEQSTPAKPSERVSGSERNKPGSASGERGGIEINETTEKSLKKKVEEHNEKHGDKKGKKVTLGMLKSVYRRGAGAFSTSHRPGMSRAQWAMARVNAFLTLVRTGKPKDSKYTTDNDLLPKGHPRKSEKSLADVVTKADDCGTGAGGFKEGNTCATGSAAQSNEGLKSKDSFEEAWNNREQKDEFMGVEVDEDGQGVPNSALDTTEEQIYAVVDNLNDGSVGTVATDAEGRALTEYSRGSTELNNYLRDEGKLPDIPDFEELYFDTETHENAKRVVEEMYWGKKGEMLVTSFPLMMKGEELEAMQAKFSEMYDKEFDQIIEFGDDMSRLAEDLQGIKDLGVDIPDYRIKEIEDAGFSLQDTYNSFMEANDGAGARDAIENARRDAFTMQGSLKDTVRLSHLQVQSNQYVDALDTSTQKPLIANLDKYKASTGLDHVPVYRGIPVSATGSWNSDVLTDMLDLDGDGKFTTRSFASTSTDPAVARGFQKNKSQSILLKIKAKTGVWVEPHTKHVNENEVLLPRNQTYKITRRKWYTDKREAGPYDKKILFVEAEEVNE